MAPPCQPSCQTIFDLTVLVSNLRAALELATQPAIQVIVVGGKLRPSELSTVGHMAENTLRDFWADDL